MRKVTAPDGREWTVGRQWLPRGLRWRKVDPSLDGSDMGSAGADDLGGIVVGIGLFVLFVVAITVVFPLVVLALELVLLLILLVAGVVGRVALRKPWHVLARTEGAAYRWPVNGWRASGERVRQVADSLASGSMPLGAELLKR